MDVLVLSTGFEPLYRVGWNKAIGDVFRGRVEIIENSKTRVIGTTSGTIPMPEIIRFKNGAYAHQWIKNAQRLKLSRKNLWMRDACKCQYCGCDVGMKHYEMEHVIPKSRGGMTVWENVVVSCSTCNKKKGACTPTEANMKLLKQPTRPKKLNTLVLSKLK